jgi:hypothetical protein
MTDQNFITPATGGFSRSDLYGIYNVVQNSIFSYPKELVIGMLRDMFSQDSYYHYVADEWGFPKVNDHTDMPLEAGYHDDNTTRIFIGEAFRHDVIMYPAILVKAGSFRSVPISLSRNKYCIEYENTLFIDGYGNQAVIKTPRYLELTGAWEGQLNIDIITRDIFSRDEISGLLMLFFTDIIYEELKNAGVIVKPPQASGPSEAEDRNQEKIYKSSITLDVRGEWRRLIPISSVLEQINICVDFSSGITNTIAYNLEINTKVDLISQINSL